MPYNYDSVTPEAVEMAIVEPVEEEPVRQVYFPNVNFDFDKSELTSLGKGRAQQIANLLQTESDVHVVLEGHTDFIGTEEYNEKLGSRRAEAVRDELIALGVSAERVSTVTFGKSQPLVAGESDWARAVNRRVEVHVDDAAVATLP
jgi:OOP family OmpA-OmpF porin